MSTVSYDNMKQSMQVILQQCLSNCGGAGPWQMARKRPARRVMHSKTLTIRFILTAEQGNVSTATSKTLRCLLRAVELPLRHRGVNAPPGTTLGEGREKI